MKSSQSRDYSGCLGYLPEHLHNHCKEVGNFSLMLLIAKSLAISIAILLSICFISSNSASALPGGYFDVGLAEYGTDGEIIDIIEWGEFTDKNTGLPVKLYIQAHEDPRGGGIGRTYLKLLLPRPNYHQGRGSKIIECFSTYSAPPEKSSYPLQRIQRGWCWQQSVAINNCDTQIELQAYVQSYHPFVCYSGSTTVDLSFSKEKNDGWSIKIIIFTPKKSIVLKGTFETGTLFSSTCK
ncbi:MAG: hypothetical protein JRI43_00365 [Deltaproteobacteria bacterium]|nr:hypothetical protein [Deltaproteobacteria bacterium]MBW1911622.1 hypothetical protein [Deltaproteobacteria bacterium]